MKVFGLYFHREDRLRRRTGDPEWNPGTVNPTTGSRSTKLRVYATVILVINWLNAIRSATMFTRTDHFGAVLHMKIALFTFSVLTAICAAPPTANAGQYATPHCKPLLFGFPCD